MKLDRRQFLAGGVAGAAVLLAGCAGQPSGAVRGAPRRPAPAGGGVPTPPGSRRGSRGLPQIEHFVVVMMENHSFDNILGLIGGETDSPSTEWSADGEEPRWHGDYVHAFHMPTECQTEGVGNDWKVSHEAYDGGTCQGFVTSTTAEAMGYFTKDDLPFTCGMARTFPIADRYFCSTMAQTDPNRRYLISGTSLGLIDDTFPRSSLPTGSSSNSSTSTASPGRTTTRPCRPSGCTSLALRTRLWPGASSRSTSSTSMPQPESFRPSAWSSPTTRNSRRRIPRTSSSATSSWARS